MQPAMELVAIGRRDTYISRASLGFQDLLHRLEVICRPIRRAQCLRKEPHHEIEVILQQALVDSDGTRSAVIDAATPVRAAVEVDADRKPPLEGQPGCSRNRTAGKPDLVDATQR